MWATKLAPFDIEQLLFHGIDTEGVLAERARIARERLGSRVREGIARLWRDERRALIEEMLARRELSATRVDPLLRSFIGNGLGRLWDAIPIGKIVDRCQRDLDETQDVAAAVAEHPAAIEALGQVRTAYALEADSIWNDARDRAALGRAKGIWGAYLTRVVPEWAKDHAGDAEHCEQLTERATKYVESAVSSRTPIEEFLRTALDPIESIPLGVEFELVLGQRISLALRKLLDSHTRAIVNAVARAAARKRPPQTADSPPLFDDAPSPFERTARQIAAAAFGELDLQVSPDLLHDACAVILDLVRYSAHLLANLEKEGASHITGVHVSREPEPAV
jgi:hypothetical protein